MNLFFPKKDASVCRFCLDSKAPENSAGEDARLVAPCACRGSSKFVHVACLRRWQSEVVSSSTSESALERANTCPVCKSSLIVDGKDFEPQAYASPGNGDSDNRVEQRAWLASILSGRFFAGGHTADSARPRGCSTNQRSPQIGLGTLLVAARPHQSESLQGSVVLITDCERFNGDNGCTIRWQGVNLDIVLQDYMDPVCEAAEMAASATVANRIGSLQVCVLAGGPLFSDRHPNGLYTVISSLPYPGGLQVATTVEQNGRSVHVSKPLTQSAATGAIYETMQGVQDTMTAEVLLVARGFTSWEEEDLNRDLRSGLWRKTLIQVDDLSGYADGSYEHTQRFRRLNRPQNCGCTCQ